jgi:hypothetical protein
MVVGNGGDQYVIAVGDDDGVRMPRQARTQPTFDHIDLADPVQLIAAEVQQYDRLRFEGVGDMREMQFVHFDRGQLRVPVHIERRDDPGVHIGAVGLGGDLAQSAQRRGGHPGGGRFAVGAGDQHGAPPAAQLLHDPRVDLQREQPADHRPVATARLAGGPCRRAGHPEGQPPPHRYLCHVAQSNDPSRSALRGAGEFTPRRQSEE